MSALECPLPGELTPFSLGTEMVLNYNLTLSNDTIAMYVSFSPVSCLSSQTLSGCGFRLLMQPLSPKRVSALFTLHPTHSTWCVHLVTTILPSSALP
jgi:hypothetical protein